MEYLDGDTAGHDPREVLAARWWSVADALATLSFGNERQGVEASVRRWRQSGREIG